MPAPIRRFGPGPGAAAMLLAILANATALHGGEPASAPRQPPSLSAQSMLGADKLDHPIKTAKNGEFKNGVLELRGPIDAAMRQRFEEAVDSGTLTTVRITSQGGEIVHALRIGAVMQARDIDVVVHDLCTGACAQYIFIAGRKRTLERESLVGFISSIKSSSALLLMATDALQAGNTRSALAERYVEQEEELYRKRGVSAALLMDPLVALQPRCVLLKRNSATVAWNTTTRYLMWVPGREYLKAAGVDYEGDWPKSNFQMGGLTFQHLKLRSARFVRYGDDDPLRSRKEKPYTLDEVTHCVLEEEPTSAPQP